ncbi:putative 6-phosphogluconolactonase [Hypsibius exemplaris]|uniref:6-phosphogluconolactonase n=1 Tax=Hypsibius exemplaris TaxID=2072580 RepID=A0A1W0WP55_HYPEX|nr:putative 6-phosphogluconolactonase [Hypsibius exemplaris]
MAAQSEIKVFDTTAELEKGLEDLLRVTANEAITKRGKYFLGVSGASMVKQLTSAIPKVYSTGEEAWDKWHIFFCDERVVAVDDKESTFGAYKETLLKEVPALEAQFVGIDSEKTAEENAKLYHNQLVKYFGNAIWPTFDLLLLGMGPDGHTCSLFPEHALLKEAKAWVAAITDSPKPPPTRITLTLPVLNHAHNVAFVLAGAGKADVLQDILEKGNSGNFPAGMVHPELKGGKLFWLLDKEAASKLTTGKTSSRSELSGIWLIVQERPCCNRASHGNSNFFGRFFLPACLSAMKVGIELGRMAFYMAFPVGLFYVFHQPQWFEASTVELRRKLYPIESEQNLKAYRTFVEELDTDQRKQEALKQSTPL